MKWIKKISEGGGGSGDTYQTLTYAASITWNTSLGNKAYVKATGDFDLDVSNLTLGTTLVLAIEHDVVDGASVVLSANFLTPGGLSIPLTAVSGAVDVLTFEVIEKDGSTYASLQNLTNDQE